MDGMSEREYSDHSGLSRGAVQNAKRGGRLVFFPTVRSTRLLPMCDGRKWPIPISTAVRLAATRQCWSVVEGVAKAI